MAVQYMLYEIGLLLMMTTGAGEYYTPVFEEGRCSLTDAGRESCHECFGEEQKEDLSLKY